MSKRRVLLPAAAVTVAATTAVGMSTASAWPWQHHPGPGHGSTGAVHTSIPIKHLVVLFDENVSFDHYFGTYPHAANTDGTTFTASPRTPRNINTEHAPGRSPATPTSTRRSG